MLPLQYGLLLFLCQAIGALGLPYVLVVWPTHAFRAWTCKSPVNFSFSSGKLPALNLDPMMPQVGAVLRQLFLRHGLSYQLSPAESEAAPQAGLKHMVRGLPQLICTALDIQADSLMSLRRPALM